MGTLLWLATFLPHALTARAYAQGQNPQALANQGIPFLLMSQYVDGSGQNKALEFYNGTGGPINLGAYRIEIYPNGASQPERIVLLNNVILPDGQTWIVVNPQASLILPTLAGLQVQQDSNLVFDGNATIILKQNNTIVDSFGQRYVALNPPNGWQTGLGWSSLNETLVRDPNVCSGRTNPDLPFNPANEWYPLGPNVFAGLGSHVTNCGPSPETLVLNEFHIEENNSLANQYIEIYGLPNTNYASYAILVVSGNQPNPGQIYRIYQLGTTSGGGYWTAFVNQQITLEANTFLLVRNLNAGVTLGFDIDANNDGAIDNNPPWTQIADSVAVVTGQGTELTYSPVVLTPNFDNLNQVVRKASRIPNGNTTEQPSAWRRNSGPPPGVVGLAVNTPNEQNREGTQIPTPTFTPTTTTTPFPTATPFVCSPPQEPVLPTGNCVNILVNGGFESGSFPPWLPGLDPVPAQVVAIAGQGGQRAALLGNPPDSGVADQVSYSSVRQLGNISGSASSVFLRWRTLEKTQETASQSPSREQDRHDVVLLTEHLQTIDVLHRSRCNYDSWYTRQADITNQRGKNLFVYFNAYNDGNGQRTWQYLDDVELVVCYPPGFTPGPTVLPTQPPATLFPTPVPPYYPPPCWPTHPQPQPCPYPYPYPYPYATPTDALQIVTPLAELAPANQGEIIIGAPATVAMIPFAVMPPVATPLPPTEPPPPPTEPPTPPFTPTEVPPTEVPPTEVPPTEPPPQEVISPAEMIGREAIEATRTARVPLGCTELIVDGDFELETATWQLTPASGSLATFETDVIHLTKGGRRSLRIGNPVATGGGALAVAERNVTLPDNFGSLVLTFDYLLQANQPIDPSSYQRADVYYMRSGQLAKRVLNKSEHDSEWRIAEEDITSLAGQPVRLHFSVLDQGSGMVMYVDNISILACQPLDAARAGTGALNLTQPEVEQQLAPTATLPPATTGNGSVTLDGFLAGEGLNFRVLRTIVILFSILVIIAFVAWGLGVPSRGRG